MTKPTTLNTWSSRILTRMQTRPKDETNPYIEGKLVIAQESGAYRLGPTSFETLQNNPTAPGPPSPPWAMLASDNVMTLTFVPSSDTGGAPVSHYQLVMRDAQKKGLFVTVFDGPIDTGTKAIPIAPQIEVGQRQFSPAYRKTRRINLKCAPRTMRAGVNGLPSA